MSALDAVRAALASAGYDTHDLSPGPGIYIAGLAPDSDGASTEPGSEWDEECDRLLAEIRELVEPLGCAADWSDDDVVIGEVQS